MKAYEFNTKISPDGKLEQPENLRHKLPPNQEVRVIILVNENSPIENTENQDWSRLAAEQFFADYSQEDEIYNQI
ncbi:hypothetical protein [Crocosphaera sp.]|uniref:hypothetical protein n=1 Tax=Crocosphaera sp. TaxID=2729996 RepID=UPI00263676DE|nr:hypothetical protein [Crocosphaera sp.]MDJ0580816.1 hypothetical protein [Crocosphaera sp.]